MRYIQAILQEVDIHIVYMSILLLISAVLVSLEWSVLLGGFLLGVVPQGRILMRAWGDYSTFNRPILPYFLTNEILVLVFLCGYWGIVSLVSIL
jgi:hypothetical protein